MTRISELPQPPAASLVAAARTHAEEARRRSDHARAELEQAVIEARRQRMTWDEIADLAGYADRHSAAKRFSTVVKEALNSDGSRLLSA